LKQTPAVPVLPDPLMDNDSDDGLDFVDLDESTDAGTTSPIKTVEEIPQVHFYCSDNIPY